MPGIAGNARLDTAGLRPRAGAGKVPRWRGRALWQAFRRWRREARATAALEALDDRMLNDIGVGRSEIQSIVHGLGRDGSRLDRTARRRSRKPCSTTP
jgi:uncharacterized protein YjiS (DUF1127 family)